LNLLKPIHASMVTEIGITAGEIWKYLDEKGGCLELAELTKLKPKGEEDIIFMALGWLCREGHVLLIQKGGKTFIELREG